tara:strand:+ start:226 stop:414 length:189 start_codon:yes stop_codon:yes gene_type:complete
MFKFLKGLITKKLVKAVVRTVSKGNPYALAAVELYSLVDILVEKEEKKEIKTGIKQDKRKKN